ncbi:MAG: hypothetical protein PHH41_02135 [Sulfurimonas sp.]|nr:hypothetical protein [Sulfurimonas sp.]MDD5201919.1 hypothetical protein [Sulfurimonas sp.]
MFNVKIVLKKKRRSNLLDLNLIVNDGTHRTILKIYPHKCFDEFISMPTFSSLDVLYFTSIIYAIDKLIPRKEADDNWSRDIEVDIPVTNVALWENAKKDLQDALNFLTSDNWNISFSQLKREYFKREKNVLPINANIEQICLFSGGLDSLAGAIDLIHNHDNVLLVSHTDGHAANYPHQTDLIDSIKNEYKLKNIKHSYLKVEADTFEDSTRGRSILFHGLAVFHAMNFGIKKIIAPENGVISINIPLNPSRSCSNSTKTMHPYFIKKLQDALYKLNIFVEIENPCLFQTKGEMLVQNQNQNLIRELANKTISCSHATLRMNWTRTDKNNCGYCIPCSIRRAAIHKLDSTLDDGLEYGYDIGRDEISFNTKNETKLDILALSYFLNQKLDLNKLKREIKLMAKVDNIDDIANMLERGYEEIKKYLNDKGSDNIQRLLH